MKITKFDEPKLQFGSSQHIDMRFGIMNYAPVDFDSDSAPKQIRVGIIGSSASIEGLSDWLIKCRDEIPAKQSRQPNLFPKFPGFNPEASFRSTIVTDSSLHRDIQSSKLTSITQIAMPDERKLEGVRAIVEEMRSLLDKKPPDVLVVAVPQEFLDAFEPPEAPVNLDDESAVVQQLLKPQAQIDFRDLLKARSMVLPRACPIQLVLPATYDPTKRRRGRSRRGVIRPIQDEATRAWNFHTAIYYKAGGIPWKLIHDQSALPTCYVGVGFFRTLDKLRLSTSVAQVFNELGTGVVVRGEAAMYEKEDRQIHLDENGAYNLLRRALDQYRMEHFAPPARVVLHKTSPFSDAEVSGFERVIQEKSIHACDMLWIGKQFTRLFRSGVYPPLRGTCLSLDSSTQVLYTKGSVEFYATYPGMYMPRTVRISCEKVSRTPRKLAEEVFALTKMNWNDTQLDGGMPITIRAARQVGEILKYANHDDDIPPHYSFYM
jgi:hypothetical protein